MADYWIALSFLVIFLPAFNMGTKSTGLDFAFCFFPSLHLKYPDEIVSYSCKIL